MSTQGQSGLNIRVHQACVYLTARACPLSFPRMCLPFRQLQSRNVPEASPSPESRQGSVTAAEKMAAALALLQWYHTDQGLCECAAWALFPISFLTDCLLGRRECWAQTPTALLLADSSQQRESCGHSTSSLPLCSVPLATWKTGIYVTSPAQQTFSCCGGGWVIVGKVSIQLYYSEWPEMSSEKYVVWYFDK